MGTGISGGEEGALNGPSIMPGGSDEAYEALGPVLETIAAQVDGTPCCTHVGPDGAGHFVKMVHNGIEYADMQLIAEAYDLLRQGLDLAPADIADVFDDWNTGDLESFLVEQTARVLRKVDDATGRPLVDVVVDEAEQKGTGRWTVQSALELGVPVSGIAEAVFARALSGHAEQRGPARQLAGPLGRVPAADRDAFVDDVRQALYASKVVAYAQGFDQIAAGSAAYGWDVDRGAMATIWRGGCIIRARFLDRVREAYDRDADLPTLLVDSYFAGVVADAQDAWRRVVVAAVPARGAGTGLRVGAGVLRRAAPRAVARRAGAGPARPVRRAHLLPGRPRGHVPHPLVRRRLRGAAGRHVRGQARVGQPALSRWTVARPRRPASGPAASPPGSRR